MRKSQAAFGATVVLGILLLSGGAVLAQQPSAKAPTTGSTQPHLGNGPAVEKSMPSSAPAATATQNTGTTDQSKTVKTMNQTEKSKVETTGK